MAVSLYRTLNENIATAQAQPWRCSKRTKRLTRDADTLGRRASEAGRGVDSAVDEGDRVAEAPVPVGDADVLQRARGKAGRRVDHAATTDAAADDFSCYGERRQAERDDCERKLGRQLHLNSPVED